jgi:hypothetical protein
MTRPGKDLERLLNKAKNAPSGYSPEWDAAEVQRRIISGELRPERACHTKARFARYDHAEKAARDLEAKHGDELMPYPCPFCAGFHLHTVRGGV